jgi:flavin-dependent dehydrogenase
MTSLDQTPHVSDMSFLNSKNLESGLPQKTDVTVVGGGIHSLIYAIHLRRREQLRGQVKTSITVLEKECVPSYKIGESTLTVFGLWLKEVGISSSLLWRLFGPKDGLAFYFLQSHGDPEDYTSFCANGPPGDFVPTLQMERKISELLLTRFAQRSGIKVLHGHAVFVENSCLAHSGSSLDVQNIETRQESTIHTRMTVDATGRFRRVASKVARLKRFEGFNTNAFWAYFEEKTDEKNIPLREYESCNTNHICLPEGYVRLLQSFEGCRLFTTKLMNVDGLG